MERLLSELIEKLVKVHGDRLLSVVLYGSSAEPDARDALSDYNVLCVMNEITVDVLAASEPVFRWWREMKNPAPVLMSIDEIRTSTDCFAIEFHDITERRRILHGTDVLADLSVDDSFYRAHVEQELRAKMLRLRQKAGGVLAEHDLLLRLMCDSLSTFCVLFRHALRLHGRNAVFGKRQVVAAADEHWGIGAETFETLIALREGSGRYKDIADPRSLFGAYLAGILKVVNAVDRLEK
jgi:hypothetical protein